MSARELDDRRRGSPSGEEELRFIRNFHDIFLSIGLVMFAAGLAIVSVLVISGMDSAKAAENWRQTAWLVAGVFAVDALIMWMLAEVFARTRRLFLPAIVILLAFSSFVAWGVLAGYVAMFGEQEFDDLTDAFEQLRLLPLVVSGATTLSIFVFYLRSKLPFSMGLGSLWLAAVGVAAFAYQYPEAVLENLTRLQLAAGIFLFILGVIFDASDPARRTRLSDNGFWLHFFAAPMIFTATLALVNGNPQSAAEIFGVQHAAATLGVVIVFALISLLINRRALLVSGLLSAAYAISVLIAKTGLDGAWIAAVTLLLLGGAMVLLGGGWHTVRRILVAPFPKTGLAARIIPPEPDRDEREPVAE